MALNVCMFTLNDVFFPTKADQAVLPSLTGKMSILKNHVPLITLLDTGLLELRSKKNWSFFVVTEGIAYITQNQVYIFSKNIKKYTFMNQNEIETKLQKIKLQFSDKKRRVLNYRKLPEFKKIKSEIEALQHMMTIKD